MSPQGVESECIVFGAFSFVLRLSRLFGIAPLYVDRVPDGYRIRVSKGYGWYGKIVTLLFVLLSLVPVIDSFTMHLGSPMMSRLVNTRLMWCADLANAATVTVAATGTSVNRMRNVIDSVAVLQRITKELQRYHKPSHVNERQRWYIAILPLVLGCYILTMDAAPRIYRAIVADQPVLLTVFHLFFGLLHMTLLLVVIQLSLITMWLQLTLQLLNSGLHNLLHEMYKDKAPSTATQLYPEAILVRRDRWPVHKSVADDVFSPTATGINKGLQAAPALLNRLSELYCLQCDIVRRLNASDGTMLVWLYLSLMMHLVIVPYRLVVVIFQSQLFDPLNLSVQVIWTLFHTMKLMLVTETCHRVHAEMVQTKQLINQMLRYTSVDDFAIISELKWFSRHFVLNEVSFSVKQFFTVDRSLAATIITSITTYLVIAIQFL